MASVLDTAELIDPEDQTAINFAVWEKVAVDPLLAGLPHRIESDRYGQIVMSPPPSPIHGHQQFGIGKLLDHHLPGGHVVTECPLSTTEGVKGVDVAWISNELWRAQREQICFTRAPEICVEVVSPGNTRRELREKKALCFETGAVEVWFCHRDGRMEFFAKEAPEKAGTSKLCPGFPQHIEVD